MNIYKNLNKINFHNLSHHKKKIICYNAFASLQAYNQPCDQIKHHQNFHLIQCTKELMDHIHQPRDQWLSIQCPEVAIPYTKKFYAQLFCYCSTTFGIIFFIAVRGTAFFPSIQEDIQGWLYASLHLTFIKDKIPRFLGNLKQYLVRCEHYLAKFTKINASLYLTGHSLGGALINLVDVQGFTFTNFPYQCISFNPPGISQLCLDYSLPLSKSNIICVRAKQDIISEIAQQPGLVVDVSMDYPSYSSLLEQIISISLLRNTLMSLKQLQALKTLLKNPRPYLAPCDAITLQSLLEAPIPYPLQYYVTQKYHMHQIEQLYLTIKSQSGGRV